MITLLLASLFVSLAPADQAPPKPVPVIEMPAPGVTQELELNDGSSVIGRVESIGDGRFVFRTISNIEMTVEVATVRSLTTVNGRIVNGEFWREDPNPTRLFFAPTGRSLKKGEAYFGVYEVIMPFVQVGVTDRFSIGGGTPLIFGDFTHPFWVTPKLQIVNSGRTEASVGVLHFFNIDHANVGIAYGVITQGSADSAFTIGGGYAYARGDDHDGGAPVLMVGGEHRVSKRIKLVTENYVFDGGGLASGGLRLFGEKLSADFGLVSPLDGDGFYLFPMINIVRKF
jgi:hypothetical protein